MAIITQYYRNVNNKIQKTEIAIEYRYRNTPQKPANIKLSAAQCNVVGGGRAVFRVICCVRARQQNKNDADKSKREEISRPETSGTTQQKSSSAFYPYGAGANLLDWSHSLIPDCIIFRTVCTFSWQPHPLTLIECF